MKRNLFTLAITSILILRSAIFSKSWIQRTFAFVAFSLFFASAAFSQTKVTGISVGAQTGTATYGTIGSPTYTISLTKNGFGGGSDNIALTWTGATPSNMTITFNPTSPYNPRNISSVTLTLTTSGTTSAGSYPFKITNTDGNGGGTSTSTGTLVIGTKTVTITGLNASTKVYDGTTTASLTGSAALSGVINSDNVTLGGTPSATFASANVGINKAVTVTGYTIGGTGASNYTLSQPSGLIANITAAPLSVSGLSAANKTYDGTTIATVSGTATFTGLIASDNGKVGYSTTGTFASANAGNNIGVTVTLTGTAAGNYTLTQPGLLANIAQATLSITANNVSKTYGSTLTGASGSTAFTSSGLKGSESIGSVTIAYGTGAAATASVGTYNGSVTPSAATGGSFNANNYIITYNSGNITVNQATLNITANSITKTYGQTLSTPVTGSTAFTMTGLKNGETIGSVTIAYGNGAAATASVGTYNNQVTPSAATGGTFNAGNYNINYFSNNINVNTANLTITATGPVRNYGDAASNNFSYYTTNFTYSATVNGETVTSVFFVITGSGNSATAAAGSTYAVTPTDFFGFTSPTGGNGFVASNYNITYVAYNGTVGKAPLTITANNVTKTYGSALSNPTTGSTAFTSSGLKNGQTIGSVTINYTTGATGTDAAGTYTGAVVPSAATGGSFNASNYNITYVNGNITVGQANLTITATSVNKPYGTTLTSGPASTGFTTSGLVNSETISTVYLTYSAGYNATDAIGTTGTITASLPITGSGTFNTSNYNITFVPGAITVAAATFDWIGAVSTDWATPGNWSINGVQQTSVYPGQNEATDIAQIGVIAYSVNQPVVSANLPNSISSLTFGSATTPATLSLAANVSFNVTGTTTLNTGSEVINLNIDNTSAFTTANYTSNSGSTFNATNGGSINITGAYSNTGTTNFGSGPITMSGSFTNSGTTTFGTGLLTFNSTTNQDFLTAKGTTSTVIFNNVLFTGGATYKFRTTPNGSGGNFELATTGVLNMSSNTIINIANASFTLLSDANSSASIGQITDASKIIGTVNVQRYITGGAAMYRGYRLLSSPVNTGTQDAYNNNIISINYLTVNSFVTGSGSGFNKTGNPSLYLFRENLAPLFSTFLNSNYRGFSDIGNPSAYQLNPDGTFSIPVGNGYLFFFRGGSTTTNPYVTTSVPNPATLVASGNLNQGSITVHDWYTPGSANLGETNTSGDPTIEGLNLVGNPYASSIDLNTLSATNSAAGIYAPNVNPVIYLLNPTSHNYDYYDTSIGQGASVETTNIVSSGLGFFVAATDPTAQLTFNESAKVTTQVTGPSLYMGKPIATETSSYLRLKMAMDSVNTDATLINFNSMATAAYSIKEDAPYKIGSGKVSLSTATANHTDLMAVNRMPLKDKTVSIPLSVNAKANGTYSLSMETIEKVPQLYDIWLMDAYRNDSLDMRHNKTYRFDVVKTDTASYGAYRFKLVMRQNPALAYHLLNFIANKATGRQVQLTWVTEHEENYTKFTVERSTDGGKTFTILGGVPSTGAGTYGLMDKNPGENNLYRLKQEDINNNITYSHIIPVGFSNLSNNLATNNINVFPNPASSEVNMTVSTAVNDSSASYNFTITNSYGLLIKQGTSTQGTWKTNVSDFLPGTYVIQIVNNKDKSFVGKSKFVKL